MSSESINSKNSIRICEHMNKDHKDSLKEFARHYAGIGTCKEIGIGTRKDIK